MVRFIKHFGLAEKLNRRDFPAFAEAYNGPGYKANRYDEKMAAACAGWEARLPRETVARTTEALQRRLSADQINTLDAQTNGIKAVETELVGGKHRTVHHIRDGGHETIGSTTDTAATSQTGAWTAVALLKGVLGTLLSLLSRVPALGQQLVSGSWSFVLASNHPALPIRGGPVTLTDASGTLTAGNSAQTPLAANAARRYLGSIGVERPFNTAARAVPTEVARWCQPKLRATGTFRPSAKFLAMSLDRVYSALADPSRRAIVRRLSEGQRLSVSALAAPLPIGLPTVMKHLDVLQRAGLIERHKRGRTVTITLTPGPMAQAAAWLDEMTAFWSQRLDRLAAFAEEDE